MSRYLSLFVVCALTLVCCKSVRAHCEVPCGIYGDEARFVQMLEDQTTIAKATLSIAELAGDMSEGADANGVNQVVRWVQTKEDHATKIQHTIAQYFMTQRIKADGANYTKKLTAAHAVMVAAMKCKQAADSVNSAKLRTTILDFYRAYEGKEPQLLQK